MTKNSFIHRNYSYKRKESLYKYQIKEVDDKFEIKILPIEVNQTKISKKDVQILFQIDNYRTLETLSFNTKYKLIPSGQANYRLADVNKFLNANLTILSYFDGMPSNFVFDWITLGEAIEFLVGKNHKTFNDKLYRRYQKKIQRTTISKIKIGKSNVLYFKNDLERLKKRIVSV